MTEPLLCFIHQPRTGGRAVEAALAAMYAGRLLRLPSFSHHPQRVAELVTKKGAGIGAVTGHHCFGLHEFLARPVVYATMLRDPVQRMWSMYHHLRAKNPNKDPRPEQVRTIQQCSFIEACQTFWRFDNPYVRKLAGPDVSPWMSSKVTDAHATAAAAHLLKIDVVGVTEDHDRFVRDLAGRMGWHYVPEVGVVNANPPELYTAPITEEERQAAHKATFYDRHLWEIAAVRAGYFD